ncbi:thioredoxin domain-containing protein 5 homolog [Chelonus insularis]|uniref:thioredoxin domain-containing protein 5 homolog n=1 Tax=Chelonus insularis TaxID=460826 RepID=UPI00158BD12D|nr:thioredoxin domain-containing protein 5 homolog [Chelonus insularis]
MGPMIFIFAVLALQSATAHDESIHTIQYNEESFLTEVPKKNHFIMFYAPWCDHCQQLMPTWDILAETLNGKDDRVYIAKVDCTTDSSICTEHDVTGYPTLKFFRMGESEGVKFRGTRDLPSLKNFINEQLGSVPEENEINIAVPEAVNGLTELTESTFKNHVATGFHFVKFYAPWCGHCQKLAPTWEELAKSYSYDTTVKISKIDCTQYRSICDHYEIKGYPTLLWIENGKKVDKYSGSRSHEDLKKYIAQMLRKNSDKNDDDGDDTMNDNIQAVLNLTGESFEHGIEKGVTFIKFFAPWCGHCKRLAPTWEELGKKFIDNPDVHIVKVDCTLSSNKQLCDEQEVDGFPTLFLYRNGKKIAEYNGSRSLENLHEFVTKHFGSHDEL